MELANSFIGLLSQPTPAQLTAALGPTATLWSQLIEWFASELHVEDQEWKSTSPKYGWALLLKLKKRTIVYLGPCDGCFRASFVLGDKAIAAARQSAPSKSLLKAIDEAPRYAEGTGLRLPVRRAADLAPVRKIAAIKLAN